MKYFLTLFLAACVGCASSAAQSLAGSGAVSGRVWQFFTEGLPDAEVALDNGDAGIHRLMRTTVDGTFRVTGLAPASGYRLRVTRNDFAGWESEEFEVFAGQTRVFDVTLRAESAAQTVAARPEVSPLDQSQEGLGTLITAPQANSLPIRERNLQDLTLLAPAVTLDRLTGAVAFPGRSPGVNLLMDGLLNGKRFSGEGTEPVAQTSIEGVQAFQVLPVGAPAEFGHTMGVTVNAISRSGSNAFHGSGYTYFSNHSLSATDRYALGRTLFQNSSQSGIDLGAPIVRDKLFVFSNFEVSDNRRQGLNRISSPLLSDSAGTAVEPSNCLASAAQCAAATAFLEDQMNVPVPYFNHWVTGSARIDYRRSRLNAFSVSANTRRGKSPEAASYGAVAPNGGLIGSGLFTGETSHGRFEWMTFPWAKVVNEFRAGYFYDRASTLASRPLDGTGSAAISVGGAAVGATRAYPSLVSEERYHLVDNFRFNFLTHAITIGGELLKTRYWRDELSDLAGTYVYPTLTTFAQDFSSRMTRSYSTFTQTLENPVRILPVTEWHIYAQDDWQPLPELRLSAGVRAERSISPQPTMVNPTYYQTGTIPSGLGVAPRIGISYAVDNRTVARLGFGFFHSLPGGDLLDALYLGNGEDQPRITVTRDQTGAPAFPAAVSRANIPAGTRNLMWASSDFSVPYSRNLHAFDPKESRASDLAEHLLSGYRWGESRDRARLEPD